MLLIFSTKYLNFVLSSLWQVVYFLYNKQEPISQTLGTKIQTLVLFLLKVSELFCYITLYRYVIDHNKEMHKTAIITSETFNARKKVHLLSMAGQLHTFVTDMVYILCSLLYRIFGSKFIQSDG